MSRLLRLSGSWSLSLGLVFGLVFVSQAIAEPTRSPIPAHVTQIEGYPFPGKIAELPRRQRTDYSEAGMGFSVRYEIPGETWADIFIYDPGEDLTSAEPHQAAADQREIALGDIRTAVSTGSYQEAKVIAKAETAPYALAHLTITQKGKTRDSYVFITVSKKNFVKIRYTTTAPDADQMAAKFAMEYARLLSR
ncbi:hypothetical protein AA309_29495 [Microvirga vignae]|uniref:PsbP C-terminal domain-containing protein n=1 Tax=Microvirga vignae TaxID=1225564 RepID=A0A0H1R3Q2_9HYPH|nr:hypothetical protein [Microvirga vignae]KLK89773.1 hypothetical protein AA309_29495 [Microvirga vignae]